MSFVITIETKAQQTHQEVAKIGAGMDGLEQKSKRIGAVIANGTRNGAAGFDAQATSVHKLASVLDGTLNKAFAGITAQVEREQKMFDRLHGPMKQAAQDFRDLESLWRQGKVAASAYANEIDRLANILPKVKTPELGGIAGQTARTNQAIDTIGLGPPPAAKKFDASAITGGMAAAAGAFAGGAYVAKEILELSDSYTNLENRLRQVAGSQSNLNTLMSATKGVADRTRSDWTATGEAYVRMIGATKQLGVSQDRALRITETLSMAIQQSGANSSEAAAGTLQLMQGLASGAVMGDEFRSINEQLNPLMGSLAKHLGVAQGELKGMAAEGKLTTKVWVDWLEASRPEVMAAFGKSTATAAQQWVVFKNQLTQTAGEVVKSSGAVTILGDALGAVGTVVKVFGDGVGLARGALDELGPVGDAIAFSMKSMAAPVTLVTGAINRLSDGVSFVTDLFGEEAPTAMEAFERGIRNANDPVLKLTADLAKLHAELTKQNQGQLAATAGEGVAALYSGLRNLGIMVNDPWGESALEKGLDRMGFKAKGSARDMNAAASAARELAEAIRVANAPQYNAATDIPDTISGGSMNHGLYPNGWNIPKQPDVDLASATLVNQQNNPNDLTLKWRENLSYLKDDLAEINEIGMTAMNSLEQSIASMAASGKFSFSSLVTSMLADLARLETHKLFAGLAKLIGGLGSSYEDGLVAGGAPGIMSIAQASQGYPKFASGGMIGPGGSGGVDSQLIRFMKSPDETVHINTPEQERDYQRGGSDTRRGAPRVLNVNVDRAGQVTHDDLEGLVVKIIERQSTAIRSRITGR